MNEHCNTYAWHPSYSSAHPSPYPYDPASHSTPTSSSMIFQSIHQLELERQRTLQMTLNMQGQLADIQSAVSQMNQNSQPSNKYVYNDFEKFGICHDAINLGTLSGSLQSGLFNGSAPSGALPPTITTTNITPQAGPTAAIAPAGAQAPVTGAPAGAQAPVTGAPTGVQVPVTGAPAGAQAPVTVVAPGVFPGTPILEAPSPTISPGMVIPPGLPVLQGASGVTAIPPGFTLPPGSVQLAPGLAILPPGTIPLPAAVPRSTP